jgi:hypothetical protein
MNETLGEAAWRLAFGGLTPEQVFALREGSAWRLLPGGARIVTRACFPSPILMRFCALMRRAIRA